jgi:DNA-binding transcriptional LysR family regulator
MSNLNHLRTFVAVYRTESVTAAALELNLTQPGVTQHLQALEAHVGRKLFFREARRMVPTDEGKSYYAQLAGPLDALSDIERKVFDARRGLHPSVRVGSPAEYFSAVALGELADSPVRLFFTLGTSEQLIDQLLQGTLDVVVATQLREDKSLTYVPLREESLQLFGPKGLAVPKIISDQRGKVAAWLQQQRWLAYGHELPSIRRFWKVNFNARPVIDPVLVIPNFMGLIRACAQGAGLTVAPAYLAREELAANTIGPIWPAQKPALNTLYLAYRRGTESEAAIAETISVLQRADTMFEQRTAVQSRYAKTSKA